MRQYLREDIIQVEEAIRDLEPYADECPLMLDILRKLLVTVRENQEPDQDC